MRNLAGVAEKEANIVAQEELLIAGINLARANRGEGEVKTTFVGFLGDWRFDRAWTYWIANAKNRDGLALDAALKLNDTVYPILGRGQPRTYGEIVRVDGYAGGMPPRDAAKFYDSSGTRVILDPQGIQQEQLDSALKKGIHIDSVEKTRFVKSPEDLRGLRAVVDHYHIDTQLGLNELARVIREGIRH